jgi:acid phosphatase family membrane protein YuiD
MVSLAIFVIDDALRMRVFLGSHGFALHELVLRLPAKDQSRYPYLETQLGHKPLEVAVGAIVGIAVTWLLMWSLPVCCNLIY